MKENLFGSRPGGSLKRVGQVEGRQVNLDGVKGTQVEGIKYN